MPARLSVRKTDPAAPLHNGDDCRQASGYGGRDAIDPVSLHKFDQEGIERSCGPHREARKRRHQCRGCSRDRDYVANSKPLVRIRRPSQTMAAAVGMRTGAWTKNGMNVRKTVEESHTAFLGSGLGDFGWPARNFDTELLGVLRVEPRPTELHRLVSNDAADGSSAEKVIQNIETNVPPGSTH